MDNESELEKQFNFRQIIETIESDSRKLLDLIESYSGSNEKIASHKEIAKVIAENYKHVLHLMNIHLGSDWGKKGHNTLD